IPGSQLTLFLAAPPLPPHQDIFYSNPFNNFIHHGVNNFLMNALTTQRQALIDEVRVLLLSVYQPANGAARGRTDPTTMRCRRRRRRCCYWFAGDREVRAARSDDERVPRGGQEAGGAASRLPGTPRQAGQRDRRHR